MQADLRNGNPRSNAVIHDLPKKRYTRKASIRVMGKDVPSLLEKLSLGHWYKYLLYVAGVLLILVIVFGSKIEVTKVLSFSIWTIVLSIFLWILDDIFRAVLNDNNFNTALAIRVSVHFLVFFIWIVVAFRSFF
jgi:hypothetical protein